MSDKLIRPTNEHERLELKQATNAALSMTGKMEAFAARTRVEKAALSKYGSVSEPASFIPIDVAADLDRAIGAPIVLKAQAALQGFALAPIDLLPGGDLDGEDLATIARETGEVVQKFAAFLPNGLDRHEKRELRAEALEAIRALWTLYRKCGEA